MNIKLTTFFLLIITISHSCNGQKKDSNDKDESVTKEYSKAKNMENSTFEIQINILKKSMLEYMEMANPSYSKNDVDECVKILNEYLLEIKNSNSKEAGMKIVENTIKKLNKLNEKCNSELIETSEREQIAEIIILASSQKGYNTKEEDITENWREW